MWEQVVKEADSKMKKTTDVTREELSKIRTGRANPALLDTVKVNYYGASTPLKQLAAITTPDPRMIVIQPFDASSVAEIQKAIQSADLGLTPQAEGKMLRIPVPTLSKERREELVKLVKKVVEDGKVSCRSIRRDANDQIKKLQKDKSITEDDEKLAMDKVQKTTDQNTKNLDQLAEEKEAELLAV